MRKPGQIISILTHSTPIDAPQGLVGGDLASGSSNVSQ